ncbi:uncharacterized protein LOC133487681 isoform X1 [Phyllopteryx taeniolatus]|uniref:uncharacterized protein LOC133487681 isoform X1 n=1 Tax=Phyllopteryx taeniolatus TaxID=161469 RepID=UPI002AD3B7EF|nr:uncharacterized protein LOC133487681 isoform X1 [Phyllopteryx taeniolatus]
MQSKGATFRHFKPLSAYARVAISEESLHKFPEPFINFHIEIFNNGATKRKWDDSDQESHDEMPAKKAFGPKVSTPDEGCFLSYCSPPAGQQSPFVHSQPSLFAKTLPIKVKSHEACKSAPEPCRSLAGTNSCLFEYELFHHQPVFDSDVDELLCLNPSYGHKGADPHVKDDVDKGYLSMCLARSLQSPPACRLILKMAEYTIHPPSKVSHSIPSPDPAVGGLSLESFEGDAKEVWNIGPPVLESSVCGEEESGSGNQKGEEVQPSETKPFSNYDTSLEVQVQSVVHVVGQPTFSSTQAAPRGKYLIKKQLSTSTPSTSKDSIHSRRQVVLNTEEDWEREKRMYVQSVHRHISEASDAAQDAVSELWGLMTHVGHDSSGRPWQHPSDLTCRNYKAHLRNPEMKMSLHEWQAKNMGTHKRFEKVQKVFERSPVP